MSKIGRSEVDFAAPPSVYVANDESGGPVAMPGRAPKDEPVIQCPNCEATLEADEMARHFDFVFPTADSDSLVQYRSITLRADVEPYSEAPAVALGLWLVTWRHLKRQAFDNPDIEIVSLGEMPQLIYALQGTFVVLDLLRADDQFHQVEDRPDLWLISGEGGIAPSE